MVDILYTVNRVHATATNATAIQAAAGTSDVVSERGANSIHSSTWRSQLGCYGSRQSDRSAEACGQADIGPPCCQQWARAQRVVGRAPPMPGVSMLQWCQDPLLATSTLIRAEVIQSISGSAPLCEPHQPSSATATCETFAKQTMACDGAAVTLDLTLCMTMQSTHPIARVSRAHRIIPHSFVHQHTSVICHVMQTSHSCLAYVLRLGGCGADHFLYLTQRLSDTALTLHGSCHARLGHASDWLLLAVLQAYQLHSSCLEVKQRA